MKLEAPLFTAKQWDWASCGWAGAGLVLSSAPHLSWKGMAKPERIENGCQREAAHSTTALCCTLLQSMTNRICREHFIY